MFTFESTKIGKLFLPEFIIDKEEVVQLIFPKIDLGDYPLQMKQLLSQSTTFKSVDAETVNQRNLFGLSYSVAKVLRHHDVELGLRWQEFMHKAQISLNTKVSSLPYGIRYILALEIALVKHDTLILDLSGNDHGTIMQILKTLTGEIRKGKTFLVMKEDTLFSEDFSLGKELQLVYAG